MARTGSSYISLSDLYLAYRKAKAEAFYENTHFHALAFSKYELALGENLKHLYAKLAAPRADWISDTEWLGGHMYAPKSVDIHSADEKDRVFYRFLDPMEDWQRQYEDGGRRRLKANFRLVITPSINFQIISALWIIKVGYKYDSALDPELSFGNRLRTGKDLELKSAGFHSPPNLDCIGLFAPYFSAYASWRSNGLRQASVPVRGFGVIS